MASQKPSPETTLQLRRIFTAPREKVFKAWTDQEALKQWWGPEGYATPSAEVDLRVGGKYRLGMRKLPDGEIFYLSGAYREVRPPERLVYTWRWEAQPELGETLVTVEFREVGDSTEVVLTHEFFPNQKVRDDHNKGWNSCLDRLAKAL
ncbi:MAG: SRPBCC domain-containing protein [candidate division NC10 bacterium]|nr:SRPBCC domain-containing protein [candidate division NC10 bacterium]MBI2457558.1 SRPBCC domain-containing protein [candidate division NC10 bacterium]